uniref:exodeoxyribonuclease III n=1 Tax=Ditylenchus dipsaci TaxID=166011 RepID=A0A915ERA4_9BILA
MAAVSRKRKNFAIFESKAGTSANENAPEIKKRKEGDPLKIFSWNVAGLRACIKKGCHTELAKWDADVVFLQETKCEELPPEIKSIADYPYKKLCFSKVKKGHSGVAMLSREKPVSVECCVGDENFDQQARWIQAEFENYYLIGVYVPNSGQKLVNLDKRKKWEGLILERLISLDKLKPVIYVGDMNVAHQEIDLKNPVSNRNKTAGFTDQEREDFTRLLEAGFVDVWRSRNPTQADVYTFWSYLGNARSRNVGWRIDYFVVSKRILVKVVDCKVHHGVLGSDHCPISMTIDV